MRLVRTENRACSATLRANLCLADIVNSLENSIQDCLLDFTLSRPFATNGLRARIAENLQGFKSKMLVLPNVPVTGHDANYRVDFLKTFRNESCSHKHQISIELCFDNRQVIGTNLLKAHLANQLGEEGKNIAILIVAEEKLRNQAYDGSIGTESEYETALLAAYSSVIDSEITLFTLLA